DGIVALAGDGICSLGRSDAVNDQINFVHFLAGNFSDGAFGGIRKSVGVDRGGEQAIFSREIVECGGVVETRAGRLISVRLSFDADTERFRAETPGRCDSRGETVASGRANDEGGIYSRARRLRVRADGGDL